MIGKNDFVEIEFTGRIVGDDGIFDSNVEADVKGAGLNSKNLKPFVLAVGHRMLPVGFDNDLIGKEVLKNYTLKLKAKDAFGKRNPAMVRMIPSKYFNEQKIVPVRGMQLNLDGQVVRVLSSDRGRTLVDFNNPLAGKDVVYNYKILRVVGNESEKINALQDFLFRRRFEFEISNKIIVFKVDKKIEPFIRIFAPKFEDILGMKVGVTKVENEEIEK
jgi:FKBP-type peptidyl-prolyl cis-trans isomerase 2